MLWSRLLRILPEHAGGAEPTVLDCGGGSGSLAVPLAVHGARVTVVDISIDALSILLRRAAEAGVSDRVTAVQGDAEALSEALADLRFDLVLAHGVLESVPDPARAVTEIASVLRPGGVASLLVANPVATVLGRLLAGDVAGALDGFRRSATTAYSPAAAIEQCLAAGLSLESVEGIGVFAEMVPGIELERSGALQALRELEQAASQVSPYREIASRLHVVVRSPAQVSG
jgi:S-adenosylmethionine-dependent methyltransferase